MKQSTKRFASTISALLLAIAAFIVFFELIQPAYGTVETLRGDVASRDQLVLDQKKVIDAVKGLKGTYEQNADRREAIGYTLPLDADVAGALLQLSSLARANGLTPSSFSISVPALQAASIAAGTPTAVARDTLVKPVGTANIQLRLVGSYSDLKQFLENLETNIRIMDVKSFTLAPVGKSTQDFYSFDIAVATYYQGQ